MDGFQHVGTPAPNAKRGPDAAKYIGGLRFNPSNGLINDQGQPSLSKLIRGRSSRYLNMRPMPHGAICGVYERAWGLGAVSTVDCTNKVQPIYYGWGYLSHKTGKLCLFITCLNLGDGVRWLAGFMGDLGGRLGGRSHHCLHQARPSFPTVSGRKCPTRSGPMIALAAPRYDGTSGSPNRS